MNVEQILLKIGIDTSSLSQGLRTIKGGLGEAGSDGEKTFLHAGTAAKAFHKTLEKLSEFSPTLGAAMTLAINPFVGVLKLVTLGADKLKEKIVELNAALDKMQEENEKATFSLLQRQLAMSKGLAEAADRARQAAKAQEKSAEAHGQNPAMVKLEADKKAAEAAHKLAVDKINREKQDESDGLAAQKKAAQEKLDEMKRRGLLTEAEHRKQTDALEKAAQSEERGIERNAQRRTAMEDLRQKQAERAATVAAGKDLQNQKTEADARLIALQAQDKQLSPNAAASTEQLTANQARTQAEHDEAMKNKSLLSTGKGVPKFIGGRWTVEELKDKTDQMDYGRAQALNAENNGLQAPSDNEHKQAKAIVEAMSHFETEIGNTSKALVSGQKNIQDNAAALKDHSDTMETANEKVLKLGEAMDQNSKEQNSQAEDIKNLNNYLSQTPAAAPKGLPGQPGANGPGNLPYQSSVEELANSGQWMTNRAFGGRVTGRFFQQGPNAREAQALLWNENMAKSSLQWSQKPGDEASKAAAGYQAQADKLRQDLVQRGLIKGQDLQDELMKNVYALIKGGKPGAGIPVQLAVSK